MKKLFSFFVPLMALFLTLAPQQVRATNYAYIKITGTAAYFARFTPTLVGSWNDAEVAALHMECSQDGTTWKTMAKVGSQNANTSKYTIKDSGGSVYGGIFKSGYTPSAFYIRMAPEKSILDAMSTSKYVQIGIDPQSANSRVTVEGNLMSMVYGDNCANKTTIPSDYCFYRLFTIRTGNGAQTNYNQVDFSGLEMPATVLTTGCYKEMFTEMASCLKKAPASLPATELTTSCYEGMFQNCTSLSESPVIMAGSLRNCGVDITDCCKNMFNGCTALTKVTTYFFEWGTTTGPTYEWISKSGIGFYCPSTLSKTYDKSHMGISATQHDITPDIYIFDVSTNSGTWDGSCNTLKYVSTAAPVVPDPQASSKTFDGWFEASSGGSPVTLSGLAAPSSGLKTYYAQFSASSITYHITVNSTTNGNISVIEKDSDPENEVSNSDVAENTDLVITATPDPGYVLVPNGLTITPKDESASPHTSGNTYTLTKDITVAATFASDECEITIANPTPAGYGTISVSDGVNSYTVGQTYTFNRQNDNGKKLTVTATPGTERVFSSWLGGLTQTGTNPYTATYTIGALTPNTHTIGATFDVKKYTLNATSSHGKVNLTADGYAAAVNTGAYAKNVTVTLTPVADDFYAFARWSDGNTDNPRTITISDNLVLSAVFEVHPQSAPASVDVYQVGTGAGGKKIVYDLSPTTDVNNPSITYTPIDLGYGVAWADRNIGATSATAAGGLFYWGGLTPISSGWPNNSYYSGINDITDRTLPLAADAAYQTMGGNTWRVPTKTEWEALLNTGNTNLSSNFTGGNYNARKGNGTITSKTVPANTITLPQVAIVRDQSYTQLGDWCNYWSASLSSDPTGGTSSPYVLYAYNAGQTLTAGASLNPTPVNVKCLFPIRAIYSPRFSQNTLTIRTINGGTTNTYIYICEYGQEVTVTANANTGDNYVFNEWNDHTGGATRTFTVTADATYTATFTQATTYNLTFRAGENGSVSGTAASAAILAGTTHSIAENTAISLTATANTFYQFKEWQNTSTHEQVSEEATYNFNLAAATDLTAVFEIANPLVLIDNENASYYEAYDALAGTENVKVRINRSISANMWSTICLPFDVDLEEAGNKGYEGKFYKYMGATGDYTGIDLHFTPTGYVDANTPYLFRSDAAVTQLDFANVTLQAREVKDEGTIGNVAFRGTILPQTLNDVVGHTILGLYNNRIYYPNTDSGTYIRAFRGYFIVDGMAGVQPRVRIVVQDNNATPIEVIELSNGETKTPVRKYVEDGVMIIEKNGVRYSVTGQEMK